MTNAELIQQAQATEVTDTVIETAIACLDFTSLGDADTEDNVRTLCQQAVTPKGNVAAVCLWPEFVNFAKRTLVDDSVDIATVVNFPSGAESQEKVIAETKKAIFDGATEIDLVFPYQSYLAGDKETAIDMVRAVKAICGDILLKVIIESGALSDAHTVREISDACLVAGADFLKTSTGKVTVGATLEAAAEMLQALADFREQTGLVRGFKASGGVRTANDAAAYIGLANAIMGSGWLSKATFRIGASSLLQDLLA